MTDNEMRTKLIEFGAPSITFKRLGFTQPTKMERIIFEDPEKKWDWQFGAYFWNEVDKRIRTRA